MRTLAIITLSVGLLLGSVGCHKSRSSHTHVDIVDELVYEVQPLNETFTDGVEFVNDFEFATVDIVGLDVDGEFTVYIEDETFTPVYEATFIGSGDQIVVQDKTDAGVPGLWYLEVSGINLTSDLQVIVTPF